MSRPRYWWYDYVKKSVIHSINSTEAPQSVQEAMADLVDDATQKAKAALAPALAVLDCIANDPEAADTSRIAASRGVLEYGLRLIETTDIIKRLEALEVNNEK